MIIPPGVEYSNDKYSPPGKDIAWSFLRTLFTGQGNNGFMPKYVYLNESYTEDTINTPEFIGQYLGPKLFQPRNNYTPNNINAWSSNTLMASPYHATTILEVFYLSNQTNVDVENLTFFYEKLKAWQEYLHDKIIQKCIESYDICKSGVDKHFTYKPCLLVNHPWETEVDMRSPIWNSTFDRLRDALAIRRWSTPFQVPNAVKEAFDYPGDEDHDSLLHLLQCLSDKSSSDDEFKQHKVYDNIRSACPFAMIDVGFTAALAKSDQDLRQMQQILTDKNRISYLQREIDVAEYRMHTSEKMLNALWSDASRTFFSRVADLEMNFNGTYSTNKTTELQFAAAYNFAALWAPLSNATMVEQLVTQTVQRSGKFSFGCGEYPIWSVGGCNQDREPLMQSSLAVFPLLNYRIANGLKRNGDGLERFIERSTLNLVCGTVNSDESDLTNCSENLLFASAFNASTHTPLGKGACGLTSTLTASIVLDLLSTDKPFRYDSEPPISSSSVIILIAIEMILAMAIGLNCLILSLNLVRRANVDEDDKFFHIDVDHHDEREQELLLQSPGLSEVFGTSVQSFDEAYDRQGILAWAHSMLSHLNPLNAMRVAPAPSADTIQRNKQ